jgi:hypothetical protein
LIFCIALVASSELAMADERMVAKYGSFECQDGFELVHPRTDLVNVSRPQITEEVELRNSPLTELRISLPIENKVSADLYFASDFLFLNGAGRPLAALNVAPPDFRVDGRQYATASGATSVDRSVMQHTRQLCVRWFIMKLPKGR